MLICPQCWHRPGRPSSLSGLPGDHLARHMEAERRGLITRADLVRLIAQLDVIAAHVLVLDLTA